MLRRHNAPIEQDASSSNSSDLHSGAFGFLQNYEHNKTPSKIKRQNIVQFKWSISIEVQQMSSQARQTNGTYVQNLV
jgi:hypothetical protein